MQPPPRVGRLRLVGRGAVLNVDGEVVRPGLGGDHVVDVDVAPLEFARRCIHQPVLLALNVDGLRVENHHPHVAGLEPASLL